MHDKLLINWGSYDVDNFGDLLFPFLVEYFLGPQYREVVHVSPTGKRSRWPDARQTSTIADVASCVDNAELVVGGGNLVSYTVSSSKNYGEDPAFAKIVHPSFSWVPYVLFAKHAIPYAYNLVGVTKRIPVAMHDLAKRALEPAAFISCRDAAGAGFLRRAGVSSPICVSPDSAIDIARIFPREGLVRRYRNEVQEKYRIPTGRTIAVVHIKERYFRGQFDALANILTQLNKKSIHPVLIPLGLCHGDDAILSDPRLRAESATLMTKPQLLLDILSILAASRYYVGSSLHGAITALSYGNSVAVVADETTSGLRKFSGFLEQVKLDHCLYRDWSTASAALAVSGLAVFGRISDATRNALAGRRDIWEELHRSYQRLHGHRTAITLDPIVERTVNHHFGI